MLSQVNRSRYSALKAGSLFRGSMGLVALTVLVSSLWALVPGCKKGGGPATPAKAPGGAEGAFVVVALPAGGSLQTTVRATEIALRSPLGDLKPGTGGLLFAYPRARALGVSVETARSGVDVVLLDEERRVLKVARGLFPAESGRVDVIPDLYQYALVLPGGASGSLGLEVGQTLSFALPEALRPARVLLPVTLLPPGRPSVTVLSELALEPEETTMGLMYRRTLPPMGGMLFRFPRSEVLQFYMKNTRISLDMIFINEARRVTGVVHRAKPLDETTQGVGPIPNRYVLEVVGGFARRHGVVEGTAVSFDIPEGLSP